GNPVVPFEVLGRDASALRTFYSNAFGWPLGPVGEGPMEYSMVHFGEAGGGIDGGIGRAPQGPGHATFYVGVDDAQAALDRIERLGGKTVVPPTKIPDGITFAMFADLEGHLVGLVAD